MRKSALGQAVCAGDVVRRHRLGVGGLRDRALQRRKRELESASDELARIGAEIERPRPRIETAEQTVGRLTQEIGGLTEDRERARATAPQMLPVIAAEPAADVGDRRYYDDAGRTGSAPPDDGRRLRRTRSSTQFRELTERGRRPDAKSTTRHAESSPR